MPPKRKLPDNLENQTDVATNQSVTTGRKKPRSNEASQSPREKSECSGSGTVKMTDDVSSPSNGPVPTTPDKSGNYDHLIRNAPIFIPTLPTKAVNIAVASRALFSLDKEHEVYESEGIDEYLKYQIEHEQNILQKGTAFPFIQALHNVNKCLREIDANEDKVFNVVLMSHNHAQTGVRLIKSIRHYDLSIQRVCLTGGTNPVDYLKAYNIALYLTSYPEEVEQALSKGFAAAATYIDQPIMDPIQDQLRIAFDLDAVLFSLESDAVYTSKGFAAYIQNEQAKADVPITEGPLKEFASAVGEMQQKFAKNRDKFPISPIRTYIVTARSACVGERAIKTLRSWGLHVDEVHFLSGAPKGPILEAIKPHIFFDDSHTNIQSAQEFGTPAAHVKLGDQGYIPRGSADVTAAKCNLNKRMSFYNQN